MDDAVEKQPGPTKSRLRWFQFSLRTLFVIVTLVAAVFRWRLHLERVRKADEADVREMVLRKMLAESPGSHLERFISVGMADNGTWMDPPSGFIERFSDLGVRLRPASSARLPGRGELDADGAERIVEDPTTGAWGEVLSVTIECWIDDHTVEVSVDKWSGWTNSTGYRATVEKRDGQWQVTGVTDEFVS